MAQIPTQPVGPPVAVPACPPTHAEGEQLFNFVMHRLQYEMGWARLRVDTLVRYDADPKDRGQWTVRHQYDHGWELHLERIRLWNPHQGSCGGCRTARIRYDRPLPTANEVIAELFGARYADLTVPAPKDGT